jgi:protein AIR1/2
VHARAPRDWETGESFGDGWGASAPINVGKRARNKDRMRMEQRAREIQELSDQDDWFGNPRNMRNRGMGGGARRDGGSKDVKIRFGPPRKRDNSPPRGPSLLERVHGDDDKHSRPRPRHRDRDRDRGRDRGERHHRDRDRERDRDRDDDPELHIRGSASRSKNPRYRDDGSRREERRGDDRRRDDSRSGDREQERHRERGGEHEFERRASWDGRGTRGPQYRGGYAR